MVLYRTVEQHTPEKKSRSTGNLLPKLPQRPTLLGLGPADPSVLPHAIRQRRMKHAACQTDVTELHELKDVQQNLMQVREELTSVNQELNQAERRLRLEVRDEMEQRVKRYERRTQEKVAFLRQKQDTSVAQMRKASIAWRESAAAATESQLKAQYQARHAEDSEVLERMSAELEQKSLLIAGYKRENLSLVARVEALQSGGAAQGGPPPSAKRSSAEDTSQLEAALAQRDATIKALREQLSRLQGGGAEGGGGERSGLAASQSTPAIGKR